MQNKPETTEPVEETELLDDEALDGVDGGHSRPTDMQTRLQNYMDVKSKVFATLTNIENKKTGAEQSITQNIK